MTFKLFLTLTLVGCLSAALTTAQGQNFQYNNQLAEVSFINGKSSEMILIRSDDNREYYFPQWKPSESRPVGYVSSSFLRVEAKFRFTCKPSAEVWVKGKCSNGFSLPPQKLHFERDRKSVV